MCKGDDVPTVIDDLIEDIVADMAPIPSVSTVFC